MTIRRAACACGQLNLAVEGEPVRISICHCYSCQRRTGSAFGVQARFPRERVTPEGRSSSYVRTAESGNKATFHFCPDCGSTVYYELEMVPHAIAVPVGAFADSSFPAPRVSIYEERMHPWVGLPADMEHID